MLSTDYIGILLQLVHPNKIFVINYLPEIYQDKRKLSFSNFYLEYTIAVNSHLMQHLLNKKYKLIKFYS